MRSYAYDPEFLACGLARRKLLKLGKRESEVCVRIYDKGLEVGILFEGQWERLEVEIKKKRAQMVCEKLVRAGDRFNELLWEYVIGSADFRVKNGRTEIDRRPRSDWWTDYIGQSTTQQIRPILLESQYETWREWIRNAALPRLLQYAAILREDPIEYFVALIEDVDPAWTETPATVEARVRADSNQLRVT